jgi:hypothetical protein
MGLFSKLFSREDEESPESQNQAADAASPGSAEGMTKSEEAAAGSAVTNDAQKKPAAPAAAAATQQVPVTKQASDDEPTVEIKPAGRKPIEIPKGAAAKANPLPGRAPAAAAAPVVPAEPDSAKRVPSPQPARGQAPARKLAAPARPVADNKAKRAPTPIAAVEIPGPPATATPSVLPLEAAVDAAMAALLEPSTSQDGPDALNDNNALDQRALADTFGDMARVHALPLRELMFQLSVGRTPRQWAATCRPVLRPLLDAAVQIGLLELVGALGAFDAALERAAAESGACIGDSAREALQSGYERLRQQMPDAFTAPDHADGRRLIMLESLLLQIPSLHRRTLAKLYAAGLSSLPQLSQAKPEEIAVVAGIDLELARTLVEHLQRFERERSRANPSTPRGHIQERLRAIVGRLSQLQAEFERAEQEDSTDRKRAARRGREATVRELDLLFAEIGDVELIEELKRCPVRGKIRRAENYLEQLQHSA